MKHFLPLFFLVLLLPFAALADGGIIPSTALPAKVVIPGQRALLCWSNGVERLAIDTSFVGEGTHFAWVVPLPGEPKIEEATTGLFTTLDYIFRPQLVHRVFPLYAVLLFCTGLGYLLLFVRRNTEPRMSDAIVALLTGLAVLPFSAPFATALALLLPWTVWRVRVGKEGYASIIAVLIFLLLISGMLLPALGTAGAPALPGEEITILNKQTIGAYETTTIASKDPAALTQWLRENGYVIPPGAENIISNYVKRGWVFVASKLRRDSSGKTESSPQPLCFTFHSDKAIYPMQLTAIGNTNLDVELFVFGPKRAEANFFDVDRCATPVFSDSDYHRPDLRIVHPLLRKWTAGSAVATRLTAHLTSEQMKDDVELRWVPFAEFHRVLYSNQGAATFGLNWAAGLFCGCLLLGSLAAVGVGNPSSIMRTVVGFAAIVGLAALAGIFFTLPKTEVRLVRLPAIRSQMYLRELQEKYLSDRDKSVSLSNDRALIGKEPAGNENVLLGGTIHEEDSPGNYLLQETTNGFDFIRFDSDGGAHTNQ